MGQAWANIFDPTQKTGRVWAEFLDPKPDPTEFYTQKIRFDPTQPEHVSDWDQAKKIQPNDQVGPGPG